MTPSAWILSSRSVFGQIDVYNSVKILIFFLFILISTVETVISQSWEAVDSSAGISVYSRSIADSDIDEFRGEIIVPADLEVVLKTLSDTENVKLWLDRCIQSKKLSGQVDQTYEAYLRFNMVFPLSDRDVIVSMTRTESQPHKIIYEGRKVTGRYSEQPGAIRMAELRTRWVLERVDGGTRVAYEHYADPGGDIASWLVNPFSVELVRNTLANLAAHVR